MRWKYRKKNVDNRREGIKNHIDAIDVIAFVGLLLVYSGVFMRYGIGAANIIAGAVILIALVLWSFR